MVAVAIGIDARERGLALFFDFFFGHPSTRVAGEGGKEALCSFPERAPSRNPVGALQEREMRARA